MAVAPLVVTEPATSLSPLLNSNVSVVRVEPFINIEKVADIVVSIATSVSPLDGFVEFIVRVTPGRVSGGGAEVEVVKDASLPVDVPALLFAAMR